MARAARVSSIIRGVQNHAFALAERINLADDFKDGCKWKHTPHYTYLQFQLNQL